MDAADDVRFDYVASLQLARRLWALGEEMTNCVINRPGKPRHGADRLARCVRHAVRPTDRRRVDAGHGIANDLVRRRRTMGRARWAEAMNEQNSINFAREVKRVEDDRNLAEDIWGGIVGHDDLPARTTDHRRPNVAQLLRHRLAHEVLIPCRRHPPIPAKLNAFVNGVKAARTAPRPASPPWPSLSASTIAACDGYVTVPALAALATSSTPWGRTRRSSQTVRTELLAADNHDGGPITISDAVAGGGAGGQGRRHPTGARACSTRCRSSAFRRPQGSSTIRSVRRTAT